MAPEPAWAYGTSSIAASERYPKPRSGDLGAPAVKRPASALRQR